MLNNIDQMRSHGCCNSGSRDILLLSSNEVVCICQLPMTYDIHCQFRILIEPNSQGEDCILFNYCAEEPYLDKSKDVCGVG